jgi:adenylate cyclase
MSGLLLKAEAASDAALGTMAFRRQQGANAIVGLEAPPFTSFDVELWIVCQKARVLVWLGRFDEANVLLAEAFRAEGTGRESPVVQYIAHLASVELACHRRDPVAAHRHAERIRTYSDQSAIPYLRVYALFATARAKTSSDACADAVRDLRAGLEFVSQANAGREHQPHLLAELSYAQYGSGQFDEAARTALSAIEMARHRRHRTAECLACMVRGAGLAVAEGAVVRLEAEQYLARAAELILVTSAALLASRLEIIRADVNARLR